MKKFYQIAFIAFFILILTAPLIRHSLTDDKPTNSENRILNQMPSFPDQIADLKQYTTHFDNYLNDQFGYREHFISGANKFKYYIFNEVLSKQITIGKSGYIFFNSHSSDSPNSLIKSVCNIAGFKQNSQNSIVRNLEKTLSHFGQNGVQTILAVVPSKSRIYPEYLPYTERKWCESLSETWLDKVLLRLSNLNYKVYYPIKKIHKWKQEFLVYLPKQFHWNGTFPFRYANDLMSELLQKNLEVQIDTESIKINSDLQNYLKGMLFYQESIKYNYHDFLLEQCHGNTCIESFTDYYANGISFRYISKLITNERLLLITDSFGAEVSSHFITGFKEVNMVNINQLKRFERVPFFEWIINQTKPTHIIFLTHDFGTASLSNKMGEYFEDLNNKIEF